MSKEKHIIDFLSKMDENNPEKRERPNTITLRFDQEAYDNICNMKKKLDALLSQEQEDFTKLFEQIMAFYKFFVDNVLGPPAYEAYIKQVNDKMQFAWAWQPVTRINAAPNPKERTDQKDIATNPPIKNHKVNLNFKPPTFQQIQELKEKFDHATNRQTNDFQELFDTALELYEAFMNTMLTDQEKYEFHILGGTMNKPQYEIVEKPQKTKQPELKLVVDNTK